MKYELSAADKTRLSQWHYHDSRPGQNERYEAINKATRDVAELLMTSCPPSRQLSLALTKLEEVRMWANNAIAVVESNQGKGV